MEHSDLQQTCKCCGKADGFDFNVPDYIWDIIVPVELQNHVVCLLCFDMFAARAGIDYTHYIQKLYFSGKIGSFTFKPIIIANNMINFVVTNKESSTISVFYKNGVSLGEIYMEIDGYYVFAPEHRGGYWDSSIMKEIAKKLDELNEEWDRNVKGDLEELEGICRL